VVKKNDTPAVNKYCADSPAPFYEDDVYYIYYEGSGTKGWGITLAQGPSPLKLVSLETHLLLPADVAWTVAPGLLPGSMVKVGGTYYLFFTPSDFKGVGVATGPSPTGPFTDSGAAILTPDDLDVGTAFEIHTPRVKYYNDVFWMLYVGVNWNIGKLFLAISADGLNWEKLGLVMAPEPQRNEASLGEPGVLSPDEGDGRWWVGVSVEPHYRSRMQPWWPWATNAWAELHLASGGSLMSLKKHGYIFSGYLSYPGIIECLDDFTMMRVDDKLQIWTGSGRDSGLGFAEVGIDGLLRANWPIQPLTAPHPTVHNLWRNKSISAGEESPFTFTFGYTNKTIYFKSDTAGALTIRVLTDERLDFEDYDTVSVSVNVPVFYLMTGKALAVRLKFSEAATVSGGVIMS